MKRILLILLTLIVVGCGKEQQGTTKEKHVVNKPKYYVGVGSQTGEELKRVLNDIITENHRKMTYKKAYNALDYTDEDPHNKDNIILLYTGRSQDKKLRSQFDGRDGWNREHVWPKSKGFKKSSANYAYTDLHHLRPADASVNSSKGAKDLDDGGKAHKEARGTRSDRDSFEPRDEVKGEIARMMFYMATRYEGEGNKYDDYHLELVDYTGTEYSKVDFDGKYGKLSTFLEWHRADPVDDWERARHERVYEVQGNRNPFIDNPQWVEDVWE